jgi:hypothetical protein
VNARSPRSASSTAGTTPGIDVACIVSARCRGATPGIDVTRLGLPDGLQEAHEKTHTDSFREATGAGRHGRAVRPSGSMVPRSGEGIPGGALWHRSRGEEA